MRGEDRDAEFTAFVVSQGPHLTAFAQLLCADRHRAEDLLQTVLERTYLRWPHVRQADPVGYVRRALLNANTDWWRRKSSAERPTGAVPDMATAGDPGLELADRDFARRALAVLTPRERAVVVLRYYDDLSEAEIAGVLGVARGTVKSTCARALAKLRVEPSLVARSLSLELEHDPWPR